MTIAIVFLFILIRLKIAGNDDNNWEIIDIQMVRAKSNRAKSSLPRAGNRNRGRLDDVRLACDIRVASQPPNLPSIWESPLNLVNLQPSCDSSKCKAVKLIPESITIDCSFYSFLFFLFFRWLLKNLRNDTRGESFGRKRERNSLVRRSESIGKTKGYLS